MLRDKIKKSEYFERFIANENERIEKFSGILEGIDKADTEKTRQCMKYLRDFCLNKLIAIYSAGYDVSSIREAFDEYMKYAAPVSSYAEMADILSIAILLNYDGDKISAVTECGEYDDALICVLKKYLKDGGLTAPEGDLQFPEEYAEYINILHQPDLSEAARQVTDFLNNRWYGTNKDMWWYDSDKSTYNTYCGYWCWVGAAICKMKKIDADLLKDCRYLPIDLI